MKTIILAILLMPLFTLGQKLPDKAISFESVNTIKAYPNQDVNPGQVSKDGNSYYFSVELEDGSGIIYLYDISRKGKIKLKDSFEVHVPGTNYGGQISVTADGMYCVFTCNESNEWNKNELYQARLNYSLHKLTNIEPLGSVNNYDVSDCYPWISEDGLRIYYLSDSKLYFAKRKNLKLAFSFPKPINLGFDDGQILSVWLNADETELFFVSDSKIYKCKRKKKNKSFSKPELFSDYFTNSEDFISAFCMDKTGKLAFIYVSPDDDMLPDHVLIYEVLTK